MSQDKEVKEVSMAVEALRKAMIAANKDELAAATSPNLSYGHSNGRVENQSEFIGNLASGASQFISIDLTEQTISITNNVAVVRHVFTAATNDSGKPGSVKLKVLLIFEKEADAWKLLARQAVRLT